MATRRTFLKGLGIAVGVTATGTPLGFAEEPKKGKKNKEKKNDDSVAVFLNEFGSDPLVVCAVLTSNIAPLRQAVRRTKRHRLTISQRLASVEVRAEQASRAFKRYLYRQLGALDDDHDDGFVIVEAHVRNATSWIGSERDLYFRLLSRLLEAADLSDFDRVFVYGNSGRPHWGGLLTGPIRQQLVQLTKGKSRVEVFPVPSRKHEGLQAAQFAAYALFRHYRGLGSEALAPIADHVKTQLDLTDRL